MKRFEKQVCENENENEKEELRKKNLECGTN